MGTTNPPTELPEPNSFVLIVTGILGVMATRKRRY
jgi:hypothetical protein